jgi:hypothetical protein
MTCRLPTTGRRAPAFGGRQVHVRQAPQIIASLPLSSPGEHERDLGGDKEPQLRIRVAWYVWLRRG